MGDTLLYVAGGCIAGSVLAWYSANESRYRREALARITVLSPGDVEQCRVILSVLCKNAEQNIY